VLFVCQKLTWAPGGTSIEKTSSGLEEELEPHEGAKKSLAPTVVPV